MSTSPDTARSWDVPSTLIPLDPRHWVAPPPVPLTPFIGRERDVTAACAALRREDVRLLTLTGTGGIGKTRLALQIAAEMAQDYPGAVAWVGLADLSEPDEIPAALANALSIVKTGNAPCSPA